MLRAILIDGSGSMRPAWDTAWKLLFDNVKDSPYPFAVFMFRERRSLSFAEYWTIEDKGVETIYTEHAIIVNLAHFIAPRLRRSIPKPPLAFTGRTPLNESIIALLEKLEQRFNRTGIRYELHVISDNRSSYKLGLDVSSEQVAEYKKNLKGLVKIVLHPVGGFLEKYLHAYDEILLDNLNKKFKVNQEGLLEEVVQLQAKAI